jgi:hypothetical protein
LNWVRHEPAIVADERPQYSDGIGNTSNQSFLGGSFGAALVSGLPSVFSGSCGSWFQILHDYGDATVGCVERLSGRAQHLIGIASDF